MAPIIIWLIIIFAVVAFNKKSVHKSVHRQGEPWKNNSGNNPPAGSAKKDKGQDPWAFDQHSNEKGKQQELKERLAKKYNRTVSGSSGSSDILSKAKASVEEDFGRTWEQEEEQRRQKERREAEQRQEQERQNQRQMQRQAQERQNQRQMQRQEQERQMQQAQRPQSQGKQEQLSRELENPGPYGQEMKEVWDLMVKGPNMEIAFERDFIAEGVEMLNRIQA